MQAEEGVESHSPSGGLFGASESSSTRSRRYRRRTASLRYLTGALADAETADHANTVPSLTMRVCMPEFPVITQQVYGLFTVIFSAAIGNRLPRESHAPWPPTATSSEGGASSKSGAGGRY